MSVFDNLMVNNTNEPNKDMKALKFETLISDIQEALDFRSDITRTFMNINAIMNPDSQTNRINPALSLIFNYNDLNNYGKIIMNLSETILVEDNSISPDGWMRTFKPLGVLDDPSNKLLASKQFIKLCRTSDNEDASYHFIFWSLMVIAVDKRDASNALSLICDFAKLLKVTDEEMMDILNVIKTVFHEETFNEEYATDESLMVCLEGENPNLHSVKTYNIFKDVLNIYN